MYISSLHPDVKEDRSHRRDSLRQKASQAAQLTRAHWCMGNTALGGVVKPRDGLAERLALMGLLAWRYFRMVLGGRGWEMYLLHHTVKMCDGVVLTTLGI